MSAEFTVESGVGSQEGSTEYSLLLTHCQVLSPVFCRAMTPPPAPAANRSLAVADVGAIRARFPALERRHAGRPVAYFDGPGGTQVPREVAEAMTGYLFQHNANTHWRYPSS